jgi:hypothetical protein
MHAAFGIDNIENMTYGRSSQRGAGAASAEAVRQALERDTDPRFALVFSTDQYEHESLAAALNAELGSLPWAGCCTAGVLAGDAFLAQGLVVSVFSRPDLRFGVGVGGPVSADGRAAGRAALAGALGALPPGTRDGHRVAILLPDALTGNAADVVRGAAEEAGTGIAWVGGGAGDNLRFVRTAQYAFGRAFHDHAVAVVIDSPRRLGTGIRHGWRPYGPPSLVTRAAGASILELDYERAFDVYRRTAERRGDLVSPASFAPFAMRHPLGIPQADGEHLIRDPLSVGEDGSLRCVAEVPDGSLVRVMEGNEEALLSAARAAASDARAAAEGPLGAALVFDCVSRSLLLGEATRDEVRALRAGIGGDVPLVGCLTFGEVAVLGAGMPQLHNKAVVVLGLPA